MTLNETKFIGLTKVISGGQTGADRGGIEAAFELGVETGGTAPLNFRTSRGDDTTLKQYKLVEDMSYAYPPRTKKNVKNSDGTVIIGTQMNSPGSVLTHKFCKELGRPVLMIGLAEQYDNEELLSEAKALAAWIRKNKVSVLNVAGNRDEFASYLHHHMTFKLIQCALLDLYYSEELFIEGV